MNHKKRKLVLSLSAALAGTVIVPQTSFATTVMEFTWQGNFTLMDPQGAALANTSITNNPASQNNQYLTPVSGSLSYILDTEDLSADFLPFHWGGNLSAPFESDGISMQLIGDGMGGPGTLVLGNMLFDWAGNQGIPASMVFDAAGFLGWLNDLSTTPGVPGDSISGIGATSAIDGTYVGAVGPADDITRSNGGYLEVGPAPIATTDWNTSLAPGCVLEDCMNIMPSGTLPLIADTATNNDRWDMSTEDPNDLVNGGFGIGGSPMTDGPFENFSLIFDFTSITYQGTVVIDDQCEPNCDLNEVPVPAAAWLLGSGLLGLIAMMRRKRAS